MNTLEFQIVPSDIRDHLSVRIQQGEVHVGPEPQQTYLRSCVCAGFYHPGHHLGALSHITGFSENGGHGARGAIEEIEQLLSRQGVRLEACECFLVGGADAAPHVYDSVVSELRRRGLRFRELDVLGSFHLKLRLDPEAGRLDLFKKSSPQRAPEAPTTFAADASLECFQNRRRRLITGASLFFRNEPLLECLRDIVIPSVVRSSGRCHIWCAGCSTGMEVYSVGMVALDSLTRCKGEHLELRLLGTDVSEEALEQGRRGEYIVTDGARNRYANLFERYCERADARTIRIGTELRSLVSFCHRDIREGSRQHRFELVVCDHVLQYFTPELQLEFLKGLRTGVQPGGFLFVSSPSTGIQQALLAGGEYEMLARSFYRRR